MDKTKICPRCKRELPLTSEYFYKNKYSASGYVSKCKDCERIYQNERAEKQRQYLVENKKDNNLVTKMCNKCGNELPATTEYFSKKKNGKYGLEGRCKECRSIYIKQWGNDNKERVTQKHKEWYQNNKEYRLKYKREWHAKNKDIAHAYCRNYEQKNKEHRKLYKKMYQMSDIGKIKSVIYANKRHDLIKSLPNTLTSEQWEQIKKDFDYKCAYCGRELPLQHDHFLALSKGGELSKDNILCACSTCNNSKHNRLFFEWYPTYKYYSKKREEKILKYLNYTSDGKQQLKLI